MTIKTRTLYRKRQVPCMDSRIAHISLSIFSDRKKPIIMLSPIMKTWISLNRKGIERREPSKIQLYKPDRSRCSQIIKALPHSQREVLVMRYYKNMSFKEIADHTKVSINTALGRMRYAILNLRKMARGKQTSY